MKLHFSGKTAFLLGGTCDLALALADRLPAEGVQATLTYRTPDGEARIANRLGAPTDLCRTRHLDLTRPETFQDLFPSPTDAPDYFIDFAQGDFQALVAGADPTDLDDYLAANISARARIVRQTARAMLHRRRGRMLFVSSAAAERPNPGQGFYAATKTAAEALYRNIGLELGDKGITTVTLRPGYVDAGRGRQYADKEKDILKKVPIGRLLTAGEVADAMMFLLSDSALGFNAVALTMDGGMTVWKR